jgi:hypothetical protein
LKNYIINIRLFQLHTLLIISIFSTLSFSCIKESELDLSSDTLKIAKIFRPNGINGKDATIESLSPNQNFNDSVYFTVFSLTKPLEVTTSRALIEFNLSVIPTHTNITTAKLSLYWISRENLTEHTGENSFSIYKIIQSWDENSVTWNNQPLFSSTNAVYVPKSISTTQSYIDIDVTAFVQDMIDNPSENYGFMLKLDEEFPYKLVTLASSDYPESSKRPKLVIYY